MNKIIAFGSIGFLILCSGCGKKEAAKPDLNNNSSGNPLTAPVDYLGAVNKAKKVAEKQIDTSSLKQSIQFFHANEDRFPTDLNELVTKHYLGALPKPPY